MPERSVLIASDQHLGSAPPERADAFHDWLERTPERAGILVLNGDLFDFWFEYGSVVPRGYTRTLSMLRSIVDAGVEVHLMGGNHDWWGGSFLREEIGLQFHQDPVLLDLAGRRALVAHGDGLGRGDLAYRALRFVLRGRVTRWAFRWLHPDVGAAIARRVSRSHDRGPEPDPRQLEVAANLERWARDRLLEDDALDLVLLGHTHLPARVEVAPGRFYLNSGDWLVHSSYLLLEPGHPPSLRYWDREQDSASSDGDAETEIHPGPRG